MLNPENFIKLILKNTINVNSIYAGENFKFGKNRKGSFEDKVLFQKYEIEAKTCILHKNCLLYTSPSPRDLWISRMPSSA